MYIINCCNNRWKTAAFSFDEAISYIETFMERLARNENSSYSLIESVDNDNGPKVLRFCLNDFNLEFIISPA